MSDPSSCSKTPGFNCRRRGAGSLSVDLKNNRQDTSLERLLVEMSLDLISCGVERNEENACDFNFLGRIGTKLETSGVNVIVVHPARKTGSMEETRRRSGVTLDRSIVL